VAGVLAFNAMLYAFFLRYGLDVKNPPNWLFQYYGYLLVTSTLIAILLPWVFRTRGHDIVWSDWLLILACMTVALYLLFNLKALQFRAGVMPTQADFWTALVGVLLILELTRRVAGLALVIISAIFIVYAFVGPYLPGFLYHSGYGMERFFTYLYTDNGILGATTAVSSTYIVLFIAFAAFLQASKVGDYFVNFAFAVAGRSRGGPAKVAVFASGLMGMINGTSAGNVVATGSLTIPLMKRVGYRPQSAAAIEATASTGGQIMPPIMGAGAFIMAEVTGIPYTELIVAALIPALLYFLSIYFMVDLEARRSNMQPMSKDELPILAELIKQVYLFIPIIILIGALFMGYSVIRAGTLALASAVVVSWISPNKMGLRSMLGALNSGARMSVQLIAVCACAGIIVGVIGLTGVGLRFSSMLLQVAATSQLLALIFAMGISMLLGMGMPTTAAYAVAAAVVAPGLIQLGISPLIAHFFVFYYAVISAITPPVALAAYAGAAIAGSEPMRTSITAFKLGIAAFIIPFMFFYSPGLLMEDTGIVIARNVVTAMIGIFFLAAAVQGWFLGHANMLLRLLLLVAALCMISGDWITDIIGIVLAIIGWGLQRIMVKNNSTA
jgi:TRAP transporter 4TM/12TM fusion protein